MLKFREESILEESANTNYDWTSKTILEIDKNESYDNSSYSFYKTHLILWKLYGITSLDVSRDWWVRNFEMRESDSVS